MASPAPRRALGSGGRAGSSLGGQGASEVAVGSVGAVTAPDLPAPLAAWVAAKNAHDVDGQVACFADDASVDDEGETVLGTQAIRSWATRVTAAYDLTVEPSGFVGDPDGAGVLSAMVSGTFPGSPLEFRFHVTLADGEITSLRTEA